MASLQDGTTVACTAQRVEFIKFNQHGESPA